MGRSTGFMALAVLFSFTGCKPQTYDDCLEAAAKDAKSVAALEVLKGVCERNHASERMVVKDVGEFDTISLTPVFDFMLAGKASQRLTRSTMERTESGIKAAVVQLSPAIEMKTEYRRLFDADGRYDSVANVQIENTGVKEFDCRNKRSRWIDITTKLYIGNRSEPQAVLGYARQEFENTEDEALRNWAYISDQAVHNDFDYVCSGNINPETVSTFGYKNICGPTYQAPCEGSK